MLRLVIITLLCISMSKSELCNGKTCIHKCCENGFSAKRKNCIPNNGTVVDFTKLKVYDVSHTNMTMVGNFGDFFDLKPGYFSDKAAMESSCLSNIYYNGFYIMRNGSVVLPIKNLSRTDVFDPENYCVEDVRNNKKQGISVFFRNTDKNANPSFFKYGFLVSSIFLLLLLIVYCLLPELINLGGMILMAYAASLMFAFVFLFTLMACGPWPTPACKSLTHLIYFFLLSSFCWMTVMSYDIWWTFRGYAKARPIHRRGTTFKFGMYGLLAWGVPLGMTIVLAILTEIDSKKLPGIIKPQIPFRGCFLDGEAKLVYMYIPMLMMILLNWTFFGLTVFNIWRLSRGTNILTGGDSSASGTTSSHRTQKHRFILYLKLSVVMGLNWLLEVISSFYPALSAVWYIFDIYNLFIGLVIFVIFVCKKKILKKLKKRLNRKQIVHFSSNASTSTSTKSRSRSTRDTMDSNPQTLPLKAINA